MFVVLMLPDIIFPFSFYISDFFLNLFIILLYYKPILLYVLLFNFSVHESDEAHNAEIEILVSKIEEAKTEISDISETLAR